MSTIHEFFQETMHKIECFAFKVPDDITARQRFGDLNALNHLVCHPNLLYRYMKSEMKTTIYYNLVFIVFLFWYLPLYFSMACETDRFLAFWLLLLTLMNVSVIPMKLLILKKMSCFVGSEDRINLSRSLWLFIRCKVYCITSKISQATFFLYLAGVFRIWQLYLKKEIDERSENHFIGVCFVLILGFIFRVILSFVKFNFIFHPKILEKEEGLLKGDLKLLKVEEYSNEIMEKFKDKNECAICCEEFKMKEKIRIMSCSGKHLFHVECIDKWLSTKKTCPTCNFILEAFNNKVDLF